jgi:ribonuclease R
MDFYEGTIINLNNTYVILNDRRIVQQTDILYSLLPNDKVLYEIIDEKIKIVELIYRDPVAVMGVVFKIVDDICYLFCPMYPKLFVPKINSNDNFKIGSVIILNVFKESMHIVSTYDSIYNRKYDKYIILDIYKTNAQNVHFTPFYLEKNKCCYTKDFKDLTHLDTFNVDPRQSKDFDDAISIDNENNKIYVHIVDANSEIIPGSNEDKHAFKNAFTLYLSEHIENILPKEMAENKLSLIKDEERKVITLEFDIDKNQEITNYNIYRSKIVIKKRYDYQEFNEEILGPNSIKFEKLIEFYKKWKRETLNIPHIKMNINNESGILEDFYFESNIDDAHKIIETLMILTNLTISKHVNLPQRFHSKVKGNFNIQNISGDKMIDSILTIKKYKPAIYDTSQFGHFGLGLNTYTHFTSPIRRYFDVIIHRNLAGLNCVNIEDVLEHINRRENYIDMIVKLYEKLKLYDYIERNIENIWEGYITNIKKVGVVVLLKDLMIEVFVFTPFDFSLCDKVSIQVKKVDWLSLQIRAQIIETNIK